MKVAMVGNPNVGKTAILNALTGGNFTVGNFPGVTVEKKEGIGVINGKKIVFVDLPGIYSFEATSLDEKIARDYILKEKPDLILNVVSAVNLERNLYLTLQLAEFGIPVILVVNMVDEAEKRGIVVDYQKLGELLGVPVVVTAAIKGRGIEELKKAILNGGAIPKVYAHDIEERIKLAEEIASKVVKFVGKRYTFDDVLDEVFMDKHLGVPIFLSLMWMVFVFTYTVAEPFTSALDRVFSDLAEFIAGSGGVVASLLGKGIVAGVGSVLVFVPNILFLFIALAVLELSGYMPRAVYLLDSIMSRFGLNGRSVIPMIIGFGCNVPAVLATRSIEDEKVRIATVLINPFMSCSARLPIYVLIAGTLFPAMGSVVIMGLYLTGVVLALFSAFIFRNTLLKGEAELIMELPPYMLPSFRDIWRLSWSRTKHFLEKAGTVILAASVVMWFVTNYPGGTMESSYAAMIGRLLQPVFAPFGWNWQIVLALISGFAAKEIVVATLGVLKVNIAAAFTPASAIAFMLFTLLYVPCVATMAAIKAEAGTKWTLFVIAYSFTLAYLLALVVMEVGTWL